jgi:Putative zinc-finger
MKCEEARELITALVDQELLDPERPLLEMHLKECARCRFALEEERRLKTEIRAAADHLRAPAQLRNRILTDPRLFREKSQSTRGWRDYIWPRSFTLRPALIVTLLLVFSLSSLYLFNVNRTKQPIAVAALETYGLFLSNELPVSRANGAAKIKEQLIRAVGGSFEPMGYDFSAMNLEPVAGAIREIQGRKILVAIYQGQGGTLFCYTFVGSEADAPQAAARFFDADKKINFYAFSRGGMNAVLHREGDVICILASEMPMEELLALARSKARPS